MRWKLRTPTTVYTVLIIPKTPRAMAARSSELSCCWGPPIQHGLALLGPVLRSCVPSSLSCVWRTDDTSVICIVYTPNPSEIKCIHPYLNRGESEVVGVSPCEPTNRNKDGSMRRNKDGQLQLNWSRCQADWKSELVQSTRTDQWACNSPCDLPVGEPRPPVADDGVADRSDPLLGAHEVHVHVMVAAACTPIHRPITHIVTCTSSLKDRTGDQRGWMGAFKNSPREQDICPEFSPTHLFSNR